MADDYAYLAMNRFANGASKTSLRELAMAKGLQDAQGWLIGQLEAYKMPNINWTSEEAISGFHYFKRQQKKTEQAKSMMLDENNMTDNNMAKNSMDGPKVIRRNFTEKAKSLAEQTALATISSKQPLQAKLLDFFSNHFAVSRNNFPMTLLAPTLEVEAIAPYLNASFAEMLIAVSSHPAMLLYLNNEKSMGPNSLTGKKRKKRKKLGSAGLNENLAREIMELHSLGVDAGYTQQDVSELARAITGWSIGSPQRGEKPSFMFREYMHEPGDREVLGKTYKTPFNKSGMLQGLNILLDLANHPATAKHVSFKLAKHFIADTPDTNLVYQMSQTWLKTSGNLPAVISTMIMHKSSWQMQPQKLKTPREFVVSACKACGVGKPSPSLFQTLEILGHGFFNSGSPAGYADNQEAWLGASALNSRIEWASHFADVIVKRKPHAPTEIAEQALGPLLSNSSLQAIKRAESKQQALTLLLMSPDFQRRYVCRRAQLKQQRIKE